jgi:hypothetical protein
MTRWALSLGVVGLILSGCAVVVPPDGDAAFLEGTWTITHEDPIDPAGVEYEAFFSASGQLSQLTATTADGATATLDTDGASTAIGGNQVTISIPRPTGTSVFEGTLSEDQNTITGSLTQQIDFDDLDIVLPGGNIIMERVADQ